MPDKELVNRIRTSVAGGRSKEQIYLGLLQEGITVDQIQEAYVSIDVTEKQADTQKRTIRIFLTIGAILVGAGVFSFIASNWQVMARPTKIAIIIISMLAADVAGWHLRERQVYPKTGEAFLLLGSVIYGAGIFLIAQMFHVRSNWPDGFILWMIGALAMALAIESFPLFVLAIPLGFIALIGHPFGIFEAFDSYNSFLLTSSFLLLAATVATFVTGWIIRKQMPPEMKRLY